MKITPTPCPEPEAGPKYWRSLDQLAETPEFQEWVDREFPAGASEFRDATSRRHFVKIMSASFLLAGLGLTGCRRPEEKILPFSKMPEGYVHGTAQYFATAMPTRGSAVPLLVKSYEGRPTKIEANSQHPVGGGTDAFVQASILGLYDPDRAMRFTRGGNEISREATTDFLAELSVKFKGNMGEGLSFLLQRSSSPSRARLQKIIAGRFPKAKFYVHEAVDFDICRQAVEQVTGQSAVPQYHLDKAKRVVSLDCDFLGTEEDSYRLIRGYARSRRLSGPQEADKLGRLYSVEALMTITGANADHRLRVPASQIPAMAARLAVEVVKTVPSEIAELAKSFKGDEKWVVECARDLVASGATGVVLPGQRQPIAVHAIALLINNALGGIGSVMTFLPAPKSDEGSISDLAASLNDGAVDTLVVLGGNPAYDAPVDLNFNQALAKARTVVRLGYYEDETFPSSTVHLPAAHYLESWGDARTGDETLVPVQPLIAPLFNGITEIEILARLAGEDIVKPHEIVRATFKGIAPDDFEEGWKKFLHDGFLSGSAAKPVSLQPQAGAVASAVKALAVIPAPTELAFEVIFHRDYSVDDGRLNNNGWLQETPDPITKVVWENVIMVSPATARKLDLEVLKQDTRPFPGREARKDHDLKSNDDGIGLRNDIVDVTVDGHKITGPIWVQPGLADNVLAVALGYGREKTGRVGKGSGFNAYKLRSSKNLHLASGAKLAKTGAARRVVTTQEHGAMEGRPIVREANVEQFQHKPDFAKNMDLDSHVPNAGPIYQHPYDSNPKTKSEIHQWGMSIDLSSCIGCNACMVACQSENNIPIVGKDMVQKGREMHWMRIDRYYAGSVENPQVANQPMLCQHCQSAPCESVCPVNATVHDEEGLNVMAYNRCIGTRYCANNCAYKVRRFNFFDYNKRPNDLADDSKGAFGKLYQGPFAKREQLDYDLIKMLSNPDVTVRMRGVMEKCSFCVQRIEGAKIAQKIKAGASGDVQVSDGAFKTACEQACPAEAIVFGNMQDENSRVSKLKKQARDYAVLGFLDTKPRVTYLARIRNPNKQMPDYAESPLSVKEYIEKDNSSPFESHGGGGVHGRTESHSTSSSAEKKGAH